MITYCLSLVETTSIKNKILNSFTVVRKSKDCLSYAKSRHWSLKQNYFVGKYITLINVLKIFSLVWKSWVLSYRQLCNLLIICQTPISNMYIPIIRYTLCLIIGKWFFPISLIPVIHMHVHWKASHSYYSLLLLNLSSELQPHVSCWRW